MDQNCNQQRLADRGPTGVPNRTRRIARSVNRPARVRFYVMLGLVLIGVGWAAVSHLLPPQVDKLLDAGHTALFKTHDYDLAIVKFSKALRLADTSDVNGRFNAVLAYKGRGHCHMQLHEYDAAVADFDEAIRLAEEIQRAGPTPFDFSDLQMDRETALKGRSLMSHRPEQTSAAGTAPGAATAGPVALRSDPFEGLQVPDGIRSLMTRALNELRQDNYDAAIATMTEAIRAVPDGTGRLAGNLSSIRGTAYLKKGDKDAALSDCEAAIRCGCLMASAFFNRGCIIAEKGKYQAAIADFNRAAELDATYAKTYHYRGLVYAKLGMQEAAEWDFTKAKQLDPDVEKKSKLRLE